MKRFLTTLLLLTAPLAAQIVVKDHISGAVLASPLLLPDVAVNDSEQDVVDVVNTGVSAATVHSATVSGLFYSLCCDTGFVLQPGQSHSLTIQFSPTKTGYFSGALQIDSLSIFLFGSSLAAPSLFVQAPSGSLQAHSGTPLVLTLNDSFSGSLPCVLRNNLTQPVIVHSLSSSGDWILSGAPSLPVTIAAGAQLPFTLARAKAASQTLLSGIVHVDQRSYAINAHPPSPGIHISVPDTLLQSGQQVPLQITFATAPTDNTEGTVTLTLETDAPIALSDPAILFSSTGTNSASFSSVSGKTSATFAGQPSLTFQTGTTAGTLHIHAEWEYSEDDLSIPLAPAEVAIEEVTAHRNSSSLDLAVTGYDNTRTVGPLTFDFYDSHGGLIGNEVTVDDSEAFYNFFYQTESAAGGMFKLTAHFPVSGGTGQIASVQVGLRNRAGNAQSSITPFH